MSLFDKDLTADLICSTISAVSKSASEDSVANVDFFKWLQSRSDKDRAFDKVYDLYDTEHPDIGTILSSKIIYKVFDAKGPEAEVLSSMMISTVRPRLFKNQDMRDRARRVKTMCKVGMRSTYVLGENGYYNSPSNFNPLLRHSFYDKFDYEKLDNYNKDFNKLNLVELSGLVNRIISHMKDLDNNDVWLGFHRVKPELVASTLARTHSLEWSDIFNLSCSLARLPDFLVKPEAADQINVAAENEEMAAALFLKSTAIRDRAKRDFRFVNLAYKPRMYPIHEFTMLPKETSKIISIVEKLPDLGGRPAFDYLWVLVPGFSMNHPAIYHPDGFFRIMIDGKLFETKSEDEISLKIDKYLVNEGILMPCVLGERDGKCYFVCPWI